MDEVTYIRITQTDAVRRELEHLPQRRFDSSGHRMRIQKFHQKYTHELNGRAEGANRNIFKKVRALLIDAQVDKIKFTSSQININYVIMRKPDNKNGIKS